MRKSMWLAGVAALLSVAIPAEASPADDRAIAAILDEGLNRSQVMVSASQLMDGIGPRLTNSDNFYRARTGPRPSSAAGTSPMCIARAFRSGSAGT